MSHAARPEELPAGRTARDAVRAALTHDRERYLAIIRGRAGGSLSASDSEEVLHGALERALLRADQVQDPTKAAAWVGRVVRNAVVDELRKRRYLTLPLEDLDLPALNDDEAAGPDCLCVLVQAEQLKAEYSEILRHVVLDGQALGAAAHSLGLTPNNASVRLHRAKQALRERLLAHCGPSAASDCGTCSCDRGRCGAR
ncbi:MAG: RNA polymerase sigma factor [Myxococcales bacterium]|nr:RNA polymerase sigma factor [Myxococcales bacterium]